MSDLNWLPNLGSQLDRALRALFVAGAAVKPAQVFIANDWRERELPLLEIVSRRGEPSAAFHGSLDYIVELHFKFPANPPKGHRNPESYQHELDRFIGGCTWLLYQADPNQGLPAVCQELTLAGRALAAAGSTAQQANNADMAGFTAQYIVPGEEERGYPTSDQGPDTSCWLESRTYRITACSAVVT